MHTRLDVEFSICAWLLGWHFGICVRVQRGFGLHGTTFVSMPTITTSYMLNLRLELSPYR